MRVLVVPFRRGKQVPAIRRNFAVVGLASLAASMLGGCIAMNTAATMSSTTLGAANAVGNAARQSAAAVSRSVSQIPAAMMYGAGPSRRIVIPMNRTQPARVARPQPVARQAPVRQAAAPSRRAVKKAELPPKKTTRRADTFLDVLPPEVLDQLSQDQVNLQAIVQAEALDGEAGETIFWELDDRAGSARAEAPHTMGVFTCRGMIESIKQGDTATEARATACRSPSMAWTLSF